MGLGAVIGLDIGNTAIKVAEVHGSKGRAYVSALGIAPTPVDSVDRNMVLDAESLGAAIKELLIASGARARHVVSSVAGQQSLVIRIIEVPKMTEKELAETMKWEVERHVPFASSELEMDYQVIHRPDVPAEAETQEVLLVVAQREMIHAHLEAIRHAGLSPAVIDVEPLAAARSLVEIGGAEELQRTVALVNIGAQTTDICIVQGGNLLFQRSIATAGNSLTQAIAAALNVSNEEADRIKKLHATVDLDAFAAGGAAAAAGEAEAPFGFGAPVFETAVETPATSEEPTLFNPFAADTPAPDAAAAPQAPAEGALPAWSPFSEPAPAASPQAPAAGALPAWSPFREPAPAPDATAAPQAPAEAPGAWSPFREAPPAADATAAAPGPFAAPAADQPAGQPGPSGAPALSPFEQPAAPAQEAAAPPFGAAAPADGDAFDLSAFATQGFAALSTPGAGALSEGELTPQQVFGIIREPLIDLVTEIRRSVDYFRGRSSEATLDLMVVSGGTARLPNLGQLLSSELSVPVVVADPFRNVPVQTTRYPEEYLRQVAPLFAVSVGLALRETVF